MSAQNKIPSQTTSLLATAVVDICDSQSCYHPVRIMLDWGSTDCFISQKCLRRLGLVRRPYSTVIHGLNQMSSISSNGITRCKIKPEKLPGPTFEAIVVPKLSSNLPLYDLHEGQWDHLKGLQLADKKYFISRRKDE